MNEISEKAVWDELVSSEDENVSPTLHEQPVQPQMMFCYNCSRAIPANSAFCPWCQTELFVTCPKCGNKYSSQYPTCNQCGTKRENAILYKNVSKAFFAPTGKMIEWKCLVCGYNHEGLNPPIKCPQCSVRADKFVCDKPYYECLVCGWKQSGTTPPIECPQCHVYQDKFKLVNE